MISMKLIITQEAIEAAVDNADRYIHDRKNPTRVLILLDAACAKQRVLDKQGCNYH
jgi:ATP-dependent Clp protease ATP-binding subunit ClpA